MRSKVDAHEYKSFKDFEADFWRIVNNSRTYNADGSLYYNLAVQLGEKVCAWNLSVNGFSEVYPLHWVKWVNDAYFASMCGVSTVVDDAFPVVISSVWSGLPVYVRTVPSLVFCTSEEFYTALFLSRSFVNFIWKLLIISSQKFYRRCICGW